MADTAPRSSPEKARALPAPSSPEVEEIRFRRLREPVVVRNAPDVAPALRAVVGTWPVVRNSRASADALSRISPDRHGLSLASRYIDEPMTNLTVTETVCGIVADLAEHYLAKTPGVVGLHCGAVRIGGTLIALTGPARAGKSTLVARLSLEPGVTVYCDDVLPVSRAGIAHGLGILPRVRLPLPPDAQRAMKRRGGRFLLNDKRYAYVACPSLAPYGTRTRLGALIVLSRQDGASAALHALNPADALHHLFRQHIPAPGQTVDLAQAGAILDRLSCYELVYARLGDAVRLLRRAFANGSLPQAQARASRQRASRPASRPKAGAAHLKHVWRRSAQVYLRTIKGESFLWNAATGTAFHLNHGAIGLWRLLATPHSGKALVEILALAFPAQERQPIARDVASLLAQMRAAGVIARHARQASAILRRGPA